MAGGTSMYQVIKIESFERTRRLVLKNICTGTEDICFDDSAVVSNVNFSFIQLDECYNCKIKLFGKIVEEPDMFSVLCKNLGEIVVGKKTMIKVLIQSDEYYIPKSMDNKTMDEFYYSYSRKDLIQVDETIHADYLKQSYMPRGVI